MSRPAVTQCGALPTESSIESALIKYYSTGDSEAFSFVTEQLTDFLEKAALNALPRRIVGRQELAEDAVQETLLKLSSGWAEPGVRWHPSRGASLKSWGYCVCQNKAYDLLRKRKNRPLTATDFSLSTNGDSGLESAFGSLVPDDCSAEPIESLLDQEAYEQAMTRLTQQSARARTIFHGVLINRDSYDSLAKQLHCVKATISREVSRLCENLSGGTAQRRLPQVSRRVRQTPQFRD